MLHTHCVHERLIHTYMMYICISSGYSGYVVLNVAYKCCTNILPCSISGPGGELEDAHLGVEGVVGHVHLALAQVDTLG